MWKRSLAVTGTAALLLAAAPTAPATAHAASFGWRPCMTLQDSGRQVLCGTLEVPRDYTDPAGPKLRLAVSRLVHTDSDHYQGVVLANPGGPGASGLTVAVSTALGLPKRIADRYDWIGFDPRGVGASVPAVTCDPSYMHPQEAPRPDYVPANEAEEQVWLDRAKRFADDCAAHHGELLPHLTTANSARDLESLRRALGVAQINYFGYSYGTYLGSVYATMFPQRVRRMVLDGVVKPSDAWYQANLEQNVAFEQRFGAFLSWIAEHDDRFGLGDTRRRVELSYYGMRDALKRNPVGRIGPSEFDDAVLRSGYGDWSWSATADLLSRWFHDRDEQALTELVAPPRPQDANEYTMYVAVECADTAWPTDWATWKYDALRQYRSGLRYNVWSNLWFNAPCMFWPTHGTVPPKIGGTGAEILLTAATGDAATPYPGALETHALFPESRLVVESGGGNHADALGNKCLRALVSAYLEDGDLPPQADGPDALCSRNPEPDPDPAAV
ncbi:alpha/beta hydrolase [Actinocorallia lasiicapitis]